MKCRVVKILLIVSLLAAPVWAQSGGQSSEWGGLSDIFELPVGARAMGMGGAYVAAADDPFALYWNPAALENVQHMGLGLYYSNLPAGTRYNYLAFTYPTLFFGTVSMGYLSIGTGDIQRSLSDATRADKQDYGRYLFLIGYGYRVMDMLSVGTTLKFERVSFVNYPDGVNGDTGNFSESAFGADVGLLFTPPFEGAVFNNLSVGLNVQNLVQRSMRAIEVRESSPRNVRLGVARWFTFSQEDRLTVAFEISRNDKIASVPTHFHFGFEYNYRGNFMLRTGFDHRGSSVGGNGPTFGIGVKHLGIQIDYSYWSGGYDVLGSSHRISIVYNIGKSREVRLEEYQAREAERIQREVLQKLEMERREAIVSGKAQARMYFENGDLIRASRAVNKVLSYDTEGNDPEFEDMRVLLDQINKALDEQRERELAAKVAKSEAEARLRRQQQRVKEHYDRALVHYEAEEYPEAIAECDRALEIDPNSELVRELRAKADEDLRKKIAKLASAAEESKRKGRLMEAIRLYSKARRLARGNRQWETLIEGRMNALERRLSYEDLLRRATNHEQNQNWAAAADLYKQALKYQPNNPAIRQKYEEAEARANAKPQEMTPQVKEWYFKAMNALSDSDYDSALKYLEEARKLQPYNITILRAIDHARAQKRRQNNAGGQ